MKRPRSRGLSARTVHLRACWCRLALALATGAAAEGQAQPTVERPPDTAAKARPRWIVLTAAPLTEPIVTDRPDFTESAQAVPRGHVQLEGGYTFTYDRERTSRTRTQTAPELLLRIGMVDGFELRFGWEGYAWHDALTQVRNTSGRRVTADDWTQSASDFELGAKLELTKQNGPRPSLALLGSLTFPTGSPRGSSGDVDPSIGLLWAYAVHERFAVAGQFLLSAPTDNGTRFVQSAASLSLGISLTERIGGYLEYYGIYPNAKDSDAAHVVNGGFTLLVTDDLQLDWRAGFGLNEEADDFFTGIGFAWRL